jgi:hypothetical protein
MPDGPKCLLFGVGNTFFESCTTVDKALAERIVEIRFSRLVSDQNRDPQLPAKLALERGVHHIQWTHRFLGNLRDPERRDKFWAMVATDSVRLRRDMNKNGSDLVQQFYNNQSNFYLIKKDENATPIFLDDFKAALMDFYNERKVDVRKLPKNWTDSLMRDPAIRLVNADFCRSCKTANPTRESCVGHYHKGNWSKRDILYGLVLKHLPLGITAEDLGEFLVNEGVPPRPEEHSQDMKDDEPVVEQDPSSLHLQFPLSDPDGVQPWQAVQTFKALRKEVQDSLSQISSKAYNPDMPGQDARTQRRKAAKQLLPGLQTPAIDKILKDAKQATKVQVQQYKLAKPGDRYSPSGL